MMTDEELLRSLRSALRRVDARSPSRDLWPSVVQRAQRPARWSLVDSSLAAVVVLVLLLFPEWFWFLAYHL